jgi:hypothetical protein
MQPSKGSSIVQSLQSRSTMLLQLRQLLLRTRRVMLGFRMLMVPPA